MYVYFCLFCFTEYPAPYELSKSELTKNDIKDRDGIIYIYIYIYIYTHTQKSIRESELSYYSLT